MKKNYYEPKISVVIMGKGIMQGPSISQGEDTDEPDSNESQIFEEENVTPRKFSPWKVDEND